MTKSEFDERKGKLRDFKGIPYKSEFEKTHSIKQFRSSKIFFIPVVKNQIPSSKKAIAGRVMNIRSFGKLVFLDLKDESGQVQVCIKNPSIKSPSIQKIKEYVDSGDFIGVCGDLYKTKKGDLCILARRIEFLSKALRPMPKEFFGVKDVELKYRKRWLDLNLNKETFDRFIFKSRLVEEVRQFLLKHNFMEVQTRTLQPVAGGAIAETFETFHNALKRKFNLRISNELDLKMLIAGGYENVFEFSTDFRNEGIDPTHLQEFTMLEWYSAYRNYEYGIKMTELLFSHLVKTLKIKNVEVDGYKINFKTPFKRVKYVDLLKNAGVDIKKSEMELRKIAEREQLDIKDKSLGNVIDEIYKKLVRPKIIQPTIITDYPRELLPLARVNDKNQNFVDAFQLVIGGEEYIKAYSELVNPVQQRKAFEEQAKAKAGGDKEAMEINEEFLEAMEQGMPPITGWGMGIERIVALLTNQKNLKDVVFFPTLADDKK